MTLAKWWFAAGIIVVAGPGCSRSPAAKEAGYLNRGKTLLKANDYARATLEFRNAMQAMPSDAEPYYQLALIALAQKDAAHAIPLLKKATELNPKHVDAQLKLSALMATASNKDILADAQGRLQSVLETAPDTSDALDTLAVIDLRLGRMDDALKHMEQAYAKSPQSIKAAVDLARLKQARNDVAGAEEVLKKLAEQLPQSTSAALALADFYFTHGRKADGEAQVRRCLQLEPKNSIGLMLLAAIQIDAGHLDQAEATYATLSQFPSGEFKTYHAVFLFREGKRDQSVAELEKLAKENLKNRDIRSLLVSAYVKQGRYADAERTLGTALKQNPNDVQALEQRAELYTRSEKFREAEQDVRSVLHFTPDSAMAHYAIARLYGLQGSQLHQRQELNETLRLDPKVFPAREDLSKLLVQSNDAKSALALLDQTPEPEKRLVRYVIARNWVLLAQDNRAEVRKNLDRALTATRHPELVYQDAVLRMSQKDYTGARRSMEEILKTYPEHATTLELLTTSYAAQNNMPKALEVLREYASKYPKSAPIQALAGIWLARVGNRGEARSALVAARNADANYDPAAIALAEMDYTDGNLDSARRNLAPLIASHPDNLRARLTLALTEYKAGNTRAAIDQYRAVIAKDASNEEALNGLAYLLSRDNPDEALKYAQSAVELAPDNAAALDTLGWIYYRKAIYHTAVTYLKAAVAKEATPTRKYHLGLAYEKVGEQVLAKQNMDSALKQDPNLTATQR